jgi:hypothetical protein
MRLSTFCGLRRDQEQVPFDFSECTPGMMNLPLSIQCTVCRAYVIYVDFIHCVESTATAYMCYDSDPLVVQASILPMFC